MWALVNSAILVRIAVVQSPGNKERTAECRRGAYFGAPYSQLYSDTCKNKGVPYYQRNCVTIFY